MERAHPKVNRPRPPTEKHTSPFIFDIRGQRYPIQDCSCLVLTSKRDGATALIRTWIGQMHSILRSFSVYIPSPYLDRNVMVCVIFRLHAALLRRVHIYLGQCYEEPISSIWYAHLRLCVFGVKTEHLLDDRKQYKGRYFDSV